MFSFSYLHRQSAIAALVIAAALASAGSAQAQVGLGLTPMREELRLAPGDQHSGTLVLSNAGPEKIRVAADLLDFFIDDNATPQFRRQWPQESEDSCRGWLTLNPMEMELGGNSQAVVRYTIRVPQSAAERSYHCAAGFTTHPVAEQARAVGLRTAVQIVTAFYVVAGTPRAEGSIQDLRLERSEDPQRPGWRAVVVIGNPSWMHFRPSGAVEVLNEGGVVVESVNFVPLPVLPKRDQTYVFPLKLESGGGAYTVRVRVDLGGNEIQEATAHVGAAHPSP